MGAETRSELLARYRAAPKLLAQSVAGSSLAQLDGAPPEPGWTARQNVHHVSDIAVMGALRLRLMLVDIEVEYWPTDQEVMQKRLRNDKRPIGPALKTVEGLVESAVSILGVLREDEWSSRVRCRATTRAASKAGLRPTRTTSKNTSTRFVTP